MIFTTIVFFLFITIFFLLYWLVFDKNLKLQNLLLLAGSYIFYAWADWRFLPLLTGISLLNFLLGIYIEKKPGANQKRVLLLIGILQGIGGLIFFKYFNFFIASFNDAFSALKINVSLQTLNIIVPLGISFFTFRTISYLLDIDKGKIKATHNWIIFFTYVAYFPSLLSGPIDKAKTFIPQLEKKRVFDYARASDGMRQILWGLFKKLVVADNCALITNYIFSNYHDLPASTLLLGTFFYCIQVYADFSGYSDMAIGISHLLGINITKNFDYPLFSQNIADFWRKWHISLTAWLTEYVFTPLSIAFRHLRKKGLILAILLNFAIIGIWHGANWTFLLFGLLHGSFYIPLILKDTMNKKRKIAKGKIFPSLREAINMVSLFILIMFTFVIFRLNTITDAFNYYKLLFSRSLLSKPITNDGVTVTVTFIFIIIMISTEWLQREKDHGLQIDSIKSRVVRMSVYYLLFLFIFIFKANEANQFIYFQF